MTRYLVVANQTATSPELLERLSELAKGGATFTLLVPATPVEHLLTSEGGETREVARRRADEALKMCRSRGLEISRAEVGDGSPLLAIDDELRAHPGEHDAVVVSTLPAGLSGWLKLDVHSQAERKFGLPVIQVVASRG